MKLYNKTEPFQRGKTFTGKKKHFKVTISYAPVDFMNTKSYWYFLLDKDDDSYTYNSLWYNLKYDTQEECVNAAENKIEEILKTSS